MPAQAQALLECLRGHGTFIKHQDYPSTKILPVALWQCTMLSNDA
jgi:hypothetical protein